MYANYHYQLSGQAGENGIFPMLEASDEYGKYDELKWLLKWNENNSGLDNIEPSILLFNINLTSSAL